MDHMNKSAAYVLLGGMAWLSGCTIERSPELFPVNDTARALGPLTAHLVGHGGGNGTISMKLPTGKLLEGRYFINVGGSASFGSLYSIMYGVHGLSTASSYGAGLDMPNGSPGVADLTDPRGFTAHCEFINNNMVGHGSGACELSNGALYRMQY